MLYMIPLYNKKKQYHLITIFIIWHDPVPKGEHMIILLDIYCFLQIQKL